MLQHLQAPMAVSGAATAASGAGLPIELRPGPGARRARRSSASSAAATDGEISESTLDRASACLEVLAIRVRSALHTQPGMVVPVGIMQARHGTATTEPVYVSGTRLAVLAGEETGWQDLRLGDVIVSVATARGGCVVAATSGGGPSRGADAGGDDDEPDDLGAAAGSDARTSTSPSRARAESGARGEARGLSSPSGIKPWRVLRQYVGAKVNRGQDGAACRASLLGALQHTIAGAPRQPRSIAMQRRRAPVPRLAAVAAPLEHRVR
jgi:hypothetical protein